MMYAFFMSLEKPAGSHTKNTSRIWRSRNHNVRMNLNENILANVRRDIMYKKRMTDFEHREIKEKVIADVKDIDSENACEKSVESKLGVKPKKKRKPDKNQKPKWKIDVEKEIETMRG